MTFTREQIDAEKARRASEPPLYTREQIEAEKARREKNDHGLIARPVGMALRSAAALPGSILDIPLLAYNLPRAVYQGFNPDAPDRTFSVADMTKQGIDKLTHNAYMPETNTEKNLVATGEAVMPMGILGRATKLTKYLPGIIQKAFKPTAANLVGTGTGAAAAQQALNIDPESTVTPLVAGILTGAAANKATRAAQSGMHALKNGAPWDDYVARAAIRHKPIGEKLIHDIPEKFGSSAIESITPHEAGKFASKGIEQYKGKASKLFNKMQDKLESYIEKHIAQDNPDRLVSIKAPMEWALEEFNKIETPVMKEAFHNTPVGKYLDTLIRTKNPKIGFSDIVHTPELAMQIKVPYSDLLNFRKNLDNSISTFGQIGTIDQGNLKTLRGKIGEEVGNKIKSIGAKPYHIYKKFNRAYELYADKRIPMINKISAEENFPTKAFLKSAEDISEGAPTPEVVINALKGADKEKYTLGLFRELGMKSGQVHGSFNTDGLPIQKFDLPTFYKKFTNLKPEVQKIYMSGLTEQMRHNIKKQLKLYQGYQNLLGQEESFSDVLFKKPSLSLASKIKKIATRKIAGAKWETPEGQQKLRNTLEGITRPKMAAPELGSIKQSAITLAPWVLNKR